MPELSSPTTQGEILSEEFLQHVYALFGMQDKVKIQQWENKGFRHTVEERIGDKLWHTWILSNNLHLVDRSRSSTPDGIHVKKVNRPEYRSLDEVVSVPTQERLFHTLFGDWFKSYDGLSKMPMGRKPTETFLRGEKEVVIEDQGKETHVAYYRLHEDLWTKESFDKRDKPRDNTYFSHPYFHVDGQQTSSGLILYRKGNSLLIVSDSGGFYPSIWYKNEIEDALQIQLPAMVDGSVTRDKPQGERLSNPHVEQTPDGVKLSVCTNGTEGVFEGRRFALHEGEQVTIVGDAEQGYRVVARKDGSERTLTEITVLYDHIDYVRNGSERNRYIPREIEDRRKISQRDVEAKDRDEFVIIKQYLSKHDFDKWDSPEELAKHTADMFRKVAPGADISVNGPRMTLKYEPLGVEGYVELSGVQNGVPTYTVHSKGQTHTINSDSFHGIGLAELGEPLFGIPQRR